MIERVSFTIHLYPKHGQLVVTAGGIKPSSRRIISTRDLPQVQAGATPNECFRAVIEALSPTHE